MIASILATLLAFAAPADEDARPKPEVPKKEKKQKQERSADYRRPHGPGKGKRADAAPEFPRMPRADEEDEFFPGGPGRDFPRAGGPGGTQFPDSGPPPVPQTNLPQEFPPAINGQWRYTRFGWRFYTLPTYGAPYAPYYGTPYGRPYYRGYRYPRY